MKIISSEVSPKVRKGNQSTKSAAAQDSVPALQVDDSRLEEMIAVAAYFRAEQRGFTPGDDLNDWFQAEAEYPNRATISAMGN